MFVCQYTKPVIVPTAGFIPGTTLAAVRIGGALPRGVTYTLDVDGREPVGGCCCPAVGKALSNRTAIIIRSRVLAYSVSRFISLTPHSCNFKHWAEPAA